MPSFIRNMDGNVRRIINNDRVRVYSRYGIYITLGSLTAAGGVIYLVRLLTAFLNLVS